MLQFDSVKTQRSMEQDALTNKGQKLTSYTVDVSEILLTRYDQMRLVVEIPWFTRFLYIPGGCFRRISEPINSSFQ